MFKLVLEEAEEPEIKLPTSAGSWKKQESSRKTSISALLTMPKLLTLWITINFGKFWKWWEYQSTWSASWEMCMQVGEGSGKPLQYSCLENPMDGGSWRAAFHGSLGVCCDWASSLSLFTFMQWKRQWQPTPVFLPGESQGWQSLVGCYLWGRTESDTTKRLHFHFSLS